MPQEKARARTRLFIDGELRGEWQNGTWESEILLQGAHTMSFYCEKKGCEETRTDLKLQADGRVIPLSAGVKGYEGSCLCRYDLGNNIPSVSDLLSMERFYHEINGTCYWKADLPIPIVRMFAEENYSGKWTYPCGVTFIWSVNCQPLF